MITRWFVLVIIFCFSLSALAQCPDFNPELDVIGEDTVCGLSGPVTINYSFQGVSSEEYLAELYFNHNDSWESFTISPGNYAYDLGTSSIVSLRVSNLDGSCQQNAEDTLIIRRTPPRQIYFTGQEMVCSYTDDYPLLINLTETRGNTKSLNLYKDGTLEASFNNINSDSLYVPSSPGSYTISNFIDVDDCPIRIRGGNRFNVVEMDSLDLIIKYNSILVMDTILTTNANVTLELDPENFEDNLVINYSETLSGNISSPNVTINNLNEGLNQVKFTISNECYVEEDSVFIIKVSQTVAKTDSFLNVCSSHSEEFGVYPRSFPNDYETSFWTDLNGLFGNVGEIITNDTLIVNTLPEAGTYFLEYAIYNQIADSTTRDTFILNVIEPPSFQFQSPLTSSDTIYTNLETQRLGIDIVGNNYDVVWNTSAGSIIKNSPDDIDISALPFEEIIKVNVSISDSLNTCPLQQDSLWIDRIEQTIAAVEDTFKICVTALTDTLFSQSIIKEPKFETSAWSTISGPQDLQSDTTFLILPPNTLAGVYVLEYMVENSLLSTTKDTLVLMIDSLPAPASLETDNYMTCSVMDSIQATGLSGLEEGVWINTENELLSIAEKTDVQLNPGLNVFKWIVSNGTCRFTDTATVAITYVAEPTNPVIQISEQVSNEMLVPQDDTVLLCNDGSYQISFSAEINEFEAFEWIPGNGSSVRDPALSPAVQVQDLIVENFGIKETILKVSIPDAEGCTAQFDTLFLSVIGRPDLSLATLSLDNQICENTGNHTVEIQNYELVDTFLWGTSPELSFINLNETPFSETEFSVPESPLTIGSIDSTTSVFVYAENRCGFSEDTLSSKIYVNLKPRVFQNLSNGNPIGLAGSDTICLNLGTENITAVIEKQDNTDSYVWDIPEIGEVETDTSLILNASDINLISSNHPEIFSIAISLKNECGILGPFKEEFYFQQPESFEFDVSLLGDTNICPEKNYRLVLNSSFQDSVILSFQDIFYAENEILPKEYTIKGDSLLQVFGTEIRVQAEILNKDLCFNNFQDFHLLKVKDVSLEKPVIPEPEPVCYGETIILEFSDSEDDLIRNYNWYLEDDLVKKSQEPFIVLSQIEESGNYYLEIESTYDCAPLSSELVNVQILENPELVVSPDIKPSGSGLEVYVKEFQEVKTNLDVEILYNGIESLNYIWDAYSVNNIITRDEALSFLINPATPELYINSFKEDEIIYILTVETENGCSDQDSIRVNFIKPFNAPTAFTPNGDQVNDTWVLEGLIKYPNANVLIYNRWGDLIFQKSSGYNGDFKGDNLPMGTYFWIVDFEDQTKQPESGSVTIIR